MPSTSLDRMLYGAMAAVLLHNDSVLFTTSPRMCRFIDCTVRREKIEAVIRRRIMMKNAILNRNVVNRVALIVAFILHSGGDVRITILSCYF
jgi:hypothetical protein